MNMNYVSMIRNAGIIFMMMVVGACADHATELPSPPTTVHTSDLDELVTHDEHEHRTVTSALSTPALDCPLDNCDVDRFFGFGSDWLRDCPHGTKKKHTAIDMPAEPGDAVYAIADGTVVLVFNAGAGWGQTILVETTEGALNTHQYTHVTPLSGIRVGSTISRRQQIGTIYAATTPHIHLGLWEGPYNDQTAAQRGALPVEDCNGDEAFPASWHDPVPHLLPGKPATLAPANYTAHADTRIALSWEDEDLADQYGVVVYGLVDGRWTYLASGIINGTSATLTANDRTWYAWTVLPRRDNLGWGWQSDWRFFRLE